MRKARYCKACEQKTEFLFTRKQEPLKCRYLLCAKSSKQGATVFSHNSNQSPSWFPVHMGLPRFLPPQTLIGGGGKIPDSEIDNGA
jgi:hypothetical protein